MIQKKPFDFHRGFVVTYISLGHLFGYANEGDYGCLKSWHGVYESIKDEKVCKEFAETRGYKFQMETESGYPRRCYLNDNEVYFNRHSSGSAETYSKPICRKSWLI